MIFGQSMFQSFFYWNCLGGYPPRKPPAPSASVSILLLLELPWWHKPNLFQLLECVCFNPSFTGIALVAFFFFFCYSIFLLFQSFFYWNCLGGLLELPQIVVGFAGFNPSFTGIALVAVGSRVSNVR